MKATNEKTKKNMTALDITAIVNDLKEKIVGLRFLKIV
jgi:ribosomal protein L29